MRPGLSARVARHTSRLVSRGLLNSGLVTVMWRRPVAGSLPQDPMIEATQPERETVTREVPALIHFVEISRSMVRQFTAIETGDVILDLLQNVELPRDGAEFIVNGERYVQKDAGKELAEFWDVMIEGQRHFRTVLATRAPGSTTGTSPN